MMLGRLWLLAILLAAPASAQSYVGSTACRDCHQSQYGAWQESNHHHALAAAASDRVAGRFAGSVTIDGITTRFIDDDGKLALVEADGPPRPVRFSIGRHPLQQYLVDGPGGRLQTYRLAWDTRPATAGGQRWFAPTAAPPPAPDSPLHWTGRLATANHMCLDCHATGFEKNYDMTRNAFDSRWPEDGVGCESCHGPGDRHAAWANAGAPAGEARVRLAAVTDRSMQVETCGQCHARRTRLGGGAAGRPLLDIARPELIRDGLYFADGQIRDEVFEFGSFDQSRKSHAGAVCGDCHEPHGGKPRAAGDGMCLGCHDGSQFATRDHHRHDPAGAGARCTECHMPTRVYMGVQARHDHRLGSPRPDLAHPAGVPDPCTSCHVDRGADWAAAQLDAAFGKDWRKPSPAADLRAAWNGHAPAAVRLAGLAADAATDWWRASLLAALAAQRGAAVQAAIGRGLADAAPLVRYGALAGANGAGGPGGLALLLGPVLDRLDDPLRGVRHQALETAMSLVDADAARAHSPVLDAVIADYRAAQQGNADQPEARVNLANLAAWQGKVDAALALLRDTTAIFPEFGPAWVNLADLQQAAGRPAQALATLREGVGRAADSAAVYYALGLALVRQGRRAEGGASLDRAYALAPDPTTAFALALAEEAAGRRDTARQIVAAQLARSPGNSMLEGLAARLTAAH